MTESLITCPRCGSNACSEISNGQLTIWTCFGCGFTTNSTLTDDHLADVEKTLPELFIALKFRDESGKTWYPLVVNLPDKSMIFAEGTSVEEWKWSAVQSKDGKTDMTTKKEFAERDFMEALDYIGYFNFK